MMITVQLQESEYLAAIRFSRRWGMKMWLFTAVSSLCYLVAGVFCLFYAARWGLSTFWGFFLIFMAPFLWVLAAYNYYLVLPKRSHRIFQQQKGLQRPYTMQWDDEKMHVEGEGVNASIVWSDFLKWRENEAFFLLYSSDVLFRPIPKRAFSDQKSISDFAQLLRDKIGRENVRAR